MGIPPTRREMELWREWLKTPDGSRYEAGWGDHENRDRAERGNAWVAVPFRRVENSVRLYEPT